ncbi:MAG: aldehyde dehydrogenase family protein [Persicimonas sp.]
MANKTNKNGRLGVHKTYKLFIGGKFPRTESGRSLTVEDHKGGFVANICRASRKDFRDSVVAAREALDGWNGRTAFNRGQILYRMAEMLETRRHAFEHALVEVAGYDDEEAAAEVDASIDRLVWYAGWSDKFPMVFGATNPVSSPHFNITQPEPTGVVAIFSPKNAPLLGLVSAFAPVIVGGNTCILIVENEAPTVAIELAEVLQNSDLPGGVINVLTGLRDELRGHVAGHKDVDGLLCFGPTKDEKREMALEAAETVKRVEFADDPDAETWRSDDQQSPYRIMPFVEFKTSWHPVGV